MIGADNCKHAPEVGGAERVTGEKEAGATGSGDFEVVQGSSNWGTGY